jgi:5-methylcytosine-specific restriction protein A
MEPLCRYHRHVGEIVGASVVDHIVALSLGGSNDRSNLAPACKSCNDRKSAVERRFARRGFDARDIMLDPDLAGWIKAAKT